MAGIIAGNSISGNSSNVVTLKEIVVPKGKYQINYRSLTQENGNTSRWQFVNGSWRNLDTIIEEDRNLAAETKKSEIKRIGNEYEQEIEKIEKIHESFRDKVIKELGGKQ